jgi:hypothetical protein
MSPRIPFAYRLCHLWLEPLGALNGAYLLAFNPRNYHTFMPPAAQYSPTSQIVYTQLASTYILFAVLEGLVLRVTTELRVWKAILFGIILCDLGQFYALWVDMGTQALLSPGLWTIKEWGTMLASVVPFVLRVAFMLGVGLGEDDDEGKKVV